MSRRPATSLSSGPYLHHLHAQQEVREQLRQELLALPVAAFNRLIARLLLRCGYHCAQVLAENQGGADLLASAPYGLSSIQTLIQAKQYRAPVSRRFVDELRGAMLRHHAPQGLLLTTSTFFGPAQRAAALECPLPVRLVDGEELLNLLLAKGLGVRAFHSGHLSLDREFLAALAVAPLAVAPLAQEHSQREPEHAAHAAQATQAAASSTWVWRDGGCGGAS